MSSGSPFRRRDFLLLLLGQTTSQLGAQVSGVAIPLLAVVTLGASPLQLGLVTAAGTIAFALIGPRRAARPPRHASDAGTRGGCQTVNSTPWASGSSPE